MALKIQHRFDIAGLRARKRLGKRASSMMTKRILSVTVAALSLCAVFFNLSAAENTNVVEAVDARFQKVMLATNTADPMELAVAPDGRVLFVERVGTLKIWKPDTKSVVVAGTLPV